MVRPGLVRGLDVPDFPDGFDVVLKDRGKVIQWALQEEVLAHRAVGGPYFADQMMNARYIEKKWGVGFELEGELERGKIEMAIKKLMKEKEGDEMRERARELKKKVAACLKRNGSSQIAIDKLVNYILSI
ncbi:hypothetical protein ACP4OV_007089 [Aristida adscensionis]